VRSATMHTAKRLRTRMDFGAEFNWVAGDMVSMPTMHGKTSLGSRHLGRRADAHRLSAVVHPISAEVICGRARGIIDAEDAQALSVQSAAGELKLSTRTLYKRIGNRDRLIRVGVERHFSTLRPDVGS
jgi:hypothetical protein